MKLLLKNKISLLEYISFKTVVFLSSFSIIFHKKVQKPIFNPKTADLYNFFPFFYEFFHNLFTPYLISPMGKKCSNHEHTPWSIFNLIKNE